MAGDRKQSILIGLVTIAVMMLWASTAPAAENTVSIPAKDDNALPRLIENHRVEAERIIEASMKIRDTADDTARSYYRMEYLRQRVMHVRSLVLVIGSFLREQERLLDRIRREEADRWELANSAQMHGMETMLKLAGHHPAPGRAVRTDSKKSGQQALYPAINLLVLPNHCGLEEELLLLREHLRLCLEGMREELAYLAARLETVSK